MNVYSVKQVTLSEAISLYVEAGDFLKEINKDIAAITNPNATIADRVTAYNSFADIQSQFSDLAKLSSTTSFFTVALTDLNAYADTIALTVPDVSNDHGGSPIPVKCKGSGRQATLHDLINALRTNDTASDFTVDAHFNEDTDSVGSANWLSKNDIVQDSKSYVGNQHNVMISNEHIKSDGTKDGISWTVSSANTCQNRDRDLHAEGSAATWEKFATGVTSAQSSSTLKTLTDLLSGKTQY